MELSPSVTEQPSCESSMRSTVPTFKDTIAMQQYHFEQSLANQELWLKQLSDAQEAKIRAAVEQTAVHAPELKYILKQEKNITLEEPKYDRATEELKSGTRPHCLSSISKQLSSTTERWGKDGKDQDHSSSRCVSFLQGLKSQRTSDDYLDHDRSEYGEEQHGNRRGRNQSKDSRYVTYQKGRNSGAGSLKHRRSRSRSRSRETYYCRSRDENLRYHRSRSRSRSRRRSRSRSRVRRRSRHMVRSRSRSRDRNRNKTRKVSPSNLESQRYQYKESCSFGPKSLRIPAPDCRNRTSHTTTRNSTDDDTATRSGVKNAREKSTSSRGLAYSNSLPTYKSKDYPGGRKSGQLKHNEMDSLKKEIIARDCWATPSSGFMELETNQVSCSEAVVKASDVEKQFPPV